MKKGESQFKQLMNNIFTSGMHKDYDIEVMRKVKMVNIMTIIALIILIPFGIVDLIKGSFTIGLFVLIVAAMLIFNQFHLRKSGNYMYTIYCGISFVAAYFFYALVTGGVNNTGYLWYFTFPLFTLFLLGPKRGSIAILLLLLPTILFLSIDNISPFFTTYTIDFKIRFIVSFLVVFGYSYLFETLREKSQLKVSQRNTELIEIVTELKNTEEQLRKSRDELEERVEERTEEIVKAKQELQAEITERKKTEEALRSEKNKLQALMDGLARTQIGIDIVGTDYKILFQNQTLQERFGNLTGELCYEKYMGLEKPCDFCPMIKAVKRNKLESVQLTGADGINYELFSAPLPNPDGTVDRAIEVVFDITARKQAEETLKESENKYRTILESIEEGYYEVDIAGNITFVNDSLCTILGYPKDELIGMNNRKYMDKKDAAKVYQDFNRVYKTGIPSEILDWELIRKDGTKRFVEISVSLIKDSKGNPTGFRGILRDVTERKLMEQDLQGERERFVTLAENAPFGMSIINAKGKYEYVNHKFTEISGYTLEDIPTGKLWFKSAYPDPAYKKKVISTWLNDLSGTKLGELRPREFKVSCKDGSQKDIYFRSVMLRNGNQIVTYEDITEKKNLESQLLQAQKMEAIGTLAGGIAHNFNNLLMSIQGNTSLMLLDTSPDHPHYERLTTIEKSVQSGSKLTSQLLGYARGGRYEVKPISINRIITDTSSTFSMTRKDITFHQDLEHTLSGVKADSGQIEQVILNICVNAAEAMVRGGELFITTRNITHKEIEKKPYTIKPGNYILLTIRDTGTGMDKATQEKVFDPFFTTKGLAKGTGLGLASVYGIIKAHGGYIDVESQKGHGTTFFLYLPASTETIGEEVQPAGTIEKGKETILLVDDEEIILDVGQELLKALGYKVLIAVSGKEALEIYKKNKEKIDTVILDMIMPVIGGGETYDRMKEINPNIKVLLSSGYSIDGQATEILKRGCDGFIQKPFNMKELSNAIREVLGS